jgi:SagB-type dehydrogenase family enzyme
MLSKISRVAAVLAILAACILFASNGKEAQTTQAQAEQREQIALPAPARTGAISLEEALSRRQSVREFSAEALSEQQLGQLLWAAQGITHGERLRTAPSAGALYPLEVYVATAKGLFHYEPQGHRIEKLAGRDLRPDLSQAALGQRSVREAAAVFLFAAEYERTARKYGPERTPRYVHLEVGHAAQNLLLQAVALGLGGVPVGAFRDADVSKALSLPTSHEPVYLLAVGHPR